MAKPIDDNKLFIFNLFHFIRYLLSKEILPFVAVFSLFFVLLPLSTLVFAFVNIIILMMVYKLAFDVLAAVAKGDMWPEIKQNYLVTNAIAVKVLIVAIIIEVLLFAMKKYGFDEVQRFYFIAFSAFVTPAIYMSLALTNSLLVALNPLVIHKVISNTVESYFIFVVFWLSTIYLHEQLLNPFLFKFVPPFIDFIISAFVEFSLLILNFYILGYILFQNKFKLVFITHHVDTTLVKQVSDFEADVDESQNPVYARIKRLIKEDEIDTALAIIKELYDNGDETFELKALYDEAMRMHYFSEKDRHLPEVRIHKYLQKNNIYKAFSILQDLYLDQKTYQEKHPEDVYSLAKYAKQSNKPQVVKQLIKNFKMKYPNHPHVVNNYFLLAQVMYEDRSQRKLVKGILQDLIKKYPYHELIPEIKSWLHGMKLMNKKKGN